MLSWLSPPRPPTIDRVHRLPGTTDAHKDPNPMSPASKQRENELEQLRELGLAKLLNKHFTETTKKIASEKAAADAAIAELMTRKESNRTRIPSSPQKRELSELDKMYIRLNKQRAECRRKEKETLMLYQRYVEKFGKTGFVTVPDALNNNKKLTPAGATATDGSIHTASTTTTATRTAPPPPPQSPQGIVPEFSKAIEQMLKENEEQTNEPSKVDADGAIGASTVDESENTIVHFNFDEVKTPSRSKAAEPSGRDANAHSSLEKKQDPITIATSPSSKSIDPPEGTGAGDEDTAYLDADQKTPIANSGYVTTTTTTTPSLTSDHHFKEVVADEDSDEQSVISGITFNSAFTREIMNDAESRMEDFIKNETEIVRKVMGVPKVASSRSLNSHGTSKAAGSVHSGGIPSESRSESQKGADDAEFMVKKMKQILDDFNQDSEKDVVANLSSGEPRPIATSNPEEEWMAYYDETFQREYFVELRSKKTQWYPPESAEEIADGSEKSGMSKSTMDMSSSAALSLSHTEVMPEYGYSMRRRSTRIKEYRKKRRRRRNRQMIAALVAVVSAGAVFLYIKHTNPSLLEDYNMSMDLVSQVSEIDSFESVAGKVKESMDTVYSNVDELLGSASVQMQDSIVWLKDQTAGPAIESTSTSSNTGKAETKMVDETSTMSKISTTEEPPLPLQREKVTESKDTKVEKGDKKKDKKREKEEKRKAKEEKKREKKEKKAKDGRPWGCNIPLSYVLHRGCRRLAKDNPAFNLNGMVQDMMQ